MGARIKTARKTRNRKESFDGNGHMMDKTNHGLIDEGAGLLKCGQISPFCSPSALINYYLNSSALGNMEI